jgi:hypothetical protein
MLFVLVSFRLRAPPRLTRQASGGDALPRKRSARALTARRIPIIG